MDAERKVAAVIRIGVRRSVIRITVREPVVRPVVPVTATADRANDVGIDEVGIASSIPYHFLRYKGTGPLFAASGKFTPYWTKQRSPP